MKIYKIALLTVLVCVCVSSCGNKTDEWVSIATPEQVNGIWEGSDTVLLPKGKFTLSTDTRARISIGVMCNVDSGEVVYAAKYDFKDFLGAATKDARFAGKTKQEIWDLFTENLKDDESVLLDKFTITMRSTIDLYTFGVEWEPVITQDDAKLRILYDVSNMFGTGRGTFFTLKKVESSKLLSAYGDIVVEVSAPEGQPDEPTVEDILEESATEESQTTDY
jgi:hypothetical protein